MTKFTSIYLDNSIFLIIGFSGGMVARVDFTSLISSTTATDVISTTVSSFAFIQSNIGNVILNSIRDYSSSLKLLLPLFLSLTGHIFLGFASKISHYPFIDPSTLNLYSIGAYTSTSTRLSVAFTEYNIKTQASTTSKLIYPGASTF